ncbi:MAG: SOS response-associated peptidase family protein [Traorella sp.]
MCGRYFIELDESEIARKIKQRLNQLSIDDYQTKEVFPSQNAIVLIPNKNQVDVDVKKWGIQSKSLLINARSETIHEKYTFKKIEKNRCVILANGFFEWNKKKKIYITKENEPFIYFAGIYNEKNEFVILTGNSEDQMKQIHPRTPIIFNHQEMLDYLNHRIDPFVNNQNLHFELCE